MTMKVRALLTLTITLATVWMSGCGHYNCGTTFGNSTCTPSGGGLGGGGGNTSGNAAYVYYVGTGLVGGLQLDSSQTLTAIPNFGTISLPTTYLGSGITVAGKKFLYIPYADTAQLFAWSIGSRQQPISCALGSEHGVGSGALEEFDHCKSGRLLPVRSRCSGQRDSGLSD